MHNLKNIEIFWCSREQKFGQKFLDEGAIKFLLESEKPKLDNLPPSDSRYTEYILNDDKREPVAENAALGPSWYRDKNLNLTGDGEKKIHYCKLILRVISAN